ncbi:MAG TPA: DegT/DnrJ/EryC1/StrS family aminotransferase [Thermodesulfobacteriota bacterium]|nr:DegT/DnrJ/EryC1/StrS family aminotransferase [Thermodesulfobacteriota bacterium]
MLLPADPKANYLAHKDEIDQAIHRVLDSGRYILGHEVAAFEGEFTQYIGVREAVGTASGTDALHLALRACGICQGDGVITVSHTAVATVAAIELAGAIPVLVDIEPATFTMDPNCLEEAIKKYRRRRWLPRGSCLKAIIPVHLYGHPADMPAIMDIASRHDLFVIEDCAQSHGAAIRGRRTGAWGHLSAFSFYPTKNLGTLGDGGAVITNDRELAERARWAREFGWRERYISYQPGMNTRLDEIQAAILRVKLHYLDKENGRRQQIAGIYDALLSATALILPRSESPLSHVYHQYVVRSNHRDDLRRFLKANSVETLIHYPLPVHLQPAYQGRVVIGPDGLRQTERICREILSLPMHPQMADEQARRVSEMISDWCRQPRGNG